MVKASALSADVAGAGGKGRKKIISVKEKKIAAGKKPMFGKMAAGKKMKSAYK